MEPASLRKCRSGECPDRVDGMPSQDFWLGFGIATILWLIAVPILGPAVSKWLEKKLA